MQRENRLPRNSPSAENAVNKKPSRLGKRANGRAGSPGSAVFCLCCPTAKSPTRLHLITVIRCSFPQLADKDLTCLLLNQAGQIVTGDDTHAEETLGPDLTTLRPSWQSDAGRQAAVTVKESRIAHHDSHPAGHGGHLRSQSGPGCGAENRRSARARCQPPLVTRRQTDWPADLSPRVSRYFRPLAGWAIHRCVTKASFLKSLCVTA